MKWFYFVRLLMVLVLCLMAVGASLRLELRGLVCSDWPLCYGSLVPSLGDMHFYSTLHRLLAGLLLVGTFALTFWKNESPKKFWAYTPFGLVIAQAILGAMTFFFKLPTLIGLVHFVMSLLILLSLVRIHSFIQGHEEVSEAAITRGKKDLILFWMIVFVAQALLGSLLKKAGATESCGIGENLWTCLDGTQSLNDGAKLNLFHRLMGSLIVGGFLLSLSQLALSLKIFFQAHRLKFMLLFILALLQPVLGWASLRFPEWIPLPTLGHLLTAALMLGLLYDLRCSLVGCELKTLGKLTPGPIEDFLVLTKLRLVMLVLVTVFIGMMVAPFSLGFLYQLFFLFGVCLVAGGACALNCVIEKEIDRQMERTKDRPLPAGRMKDVTAIVIGVALIGFGSLIVWYAANFLTAMLGVAAGLIYLYIYTPMKTRSPYALYVGAIPGAIPPLMGWTAVTNEISGQGFYLFLFLFIWQIPHFMAISVYLAKDYSKARIITFVETKGLTFIRYSIFLYSFALGSLAFWHEDGHRALYKNISLVLAGLFFGLALRGLMLDQEEDKIQKWSKIYFYGTLFYLPLQLGALLFLKSF